VKLEKKRIRRIKLERSHEKKNEYVQEWILDESEYERFAQECISLNKMKSFIAQTALGDIQVSKEVK
jgi:hypothetical protein